MSAIGGVNGGLKGLVVAWCGIAAVNAVHAAHRWLWVRGVRRPADD